MKTILKKIFKRKEKATVQELPNKKPFFCARAVKSKYRVHCVLEFENNPVRSVKFEIHANSRAHARHLISKGMELKIIRTNKVKNNDRNS